MPADISDGKEWMSKDPKVHMKNYVKGKQFIRKNWEISWLHFNKPTAKYVVF